MPPEGSATGSVTISLSSILRLTAWPCGIFPFLGHRSGSGFYALSMILRVWVLVPLTLQKGSACGHGEEGPAEAPTPTHSCSPAHPSVLATWTLPLGVGGLVSAVTKAGAFRIVGGLIDPKPLKTIGQLPLNIKGQEDASQAPDDARSNLGGKTTSELCSRSPSKGS